MVTGAVVFISYTLSLLFTLEHSERHCCEFASPAEGLHSQGICSSACPGGGCPPVTGSAEAGHSALEVW